MDVDGTEEGLSMEMRYELLVCAKADVAKTAAVWGATHVVSLLDIGDHIETPGWMASRDHLRLNFEDTEDSRDAFGPKEEHVADILRFARALPDGARCLVHCFGGIRRSTAAAYAMAVQECGAGRAAEAIEHVLSIRPQAMPNRLLVSHADRLLGAGGCMKNAADARCRSRTLIIPNDNQKPAPPIFRLR